MYNMYVLRAPKEQKRTLNPLERELWMVASHSWVLGWNTDPLQGQLVLLNTVPFPLYQTYYLIGRDKNLTR